MNQRKCRENQPASASIAAWVGLALAFALTAQAAPRPPQDAPPDAIWLNGNIYTMDAARPRAEALAVAGGRIVAVGSNDEIRKLAGTSAKANDLNGATVLPGLIDAHGHVAGLGLFGLGRLDLSDAKSFDDVVAAIAEKAKTAKPGEWILGGRWDHESWPDRKLPTHEKLSAATPHNPVWITRVDGHAGLANAAAMKLAGVTKDTPAPGGGEVLRGADGEPTGVFVDNAETLIARHVAAGGDDAAAILKAQEMCFAAGLTGVHDPGVSPAEIEVYQRLAASKQLKLRVYAMVSGAHAIEYFKTHKPAAGDVLTVRACKLYMDGAMGSRGAWLLEPYADRPRDEKGQPYTGLAVSSPEFIKLVALDGLRNGYQVCVHAIGDRGNREVLNAFEQAMKQIPAKDHRFRIEHAQLLHLDDIPRFARLGVIASMQPTHCTSDMRWVHARVGEKRAQGAYAWARLLRSGARLAAGSDFPVESHNPFLGIYAAVTRQTPDGQPPGGWHGDQRMTREEALRAFTVEAAYAAFEEDRKGSLTPGKLADFIVLDRDVLTCDALEIPKTGVLRTVVGGETVFQRAGENK